MRVRRFQIWYLKEAWIYFIDIKIFNLDLNGSLCSEWVKNWLTGLEIYDGTLGSLFEPAWYIRANWELRIWIRLTLTIPYMLLSVSLDIPLWLKIFFLRQNICWWPKPFGLSGLEKSLGLGKTFLCHLGISGLTKSSIFGFVSLSRFQIWYSQLGIPYFFPYRSVQ